MPHVLTLLTLKIYQMLYEFISLSERPIAKRTAEIRLIVFLLVISLFQVLFALPAKSSPVSTENTVLYNNYSLSGYRIAV